MSKHSMRFGGSGKSERGFKRFDNGLRAWLQHAESLHERMLRIFFDEFKKRVFLAALRIQDFHAMPGGFA